MKQYYLFIFIASFISACHQQDQSKEAEPIAPLSLNVERIDIKNYSEARQVFWKYLYPESGKTLYCAQAFNNNERSGINIEHVFPMSWVRNGLGCGTRKACRNNSAVFNQIEADLHNLYPARTDVNKERSSLRFGLIQGEQRKFGPNCDFEVDTRRRMVEPASDVRGDIARAMFYMANEYQQYGLVIFKKQQWLLRDWHQADPPSELEKSRNALINQIQGKSNPFIESPDCLLTLIEQGHFIN